MNASDQPFYVGYRPLPSAHRRMLRISVPCVLTVVIAFAAVIAASQPDAGDGVWATNTETVSGTLILSPYPMILSEDGNRFLLVEAGKFGVAPERLGKEAAIVSARGYTLERPPVPGLNPSLRMLELVPDDDAVERATETMATQNTLVLPDLEASGTTLTILGEILDSKCFLGAMKPGEGRTHRSCAQLCIAGGVPPMLEGRDQSGTRRRLLVLDAEGRAANQLVLDYAGLPVTVRGEFARFSGIDVLLLSGITLAR